MEENCSKRRHLHEESNSSSDGESSLIPRKQPNFRKSSEYSVPSTSSEIDSTTPEKCALSYDALNSASDTDGLLGYRKEPTLPRKTPDNSTVDSSAKEKAAVAKEYKRTEVEKIDSENSESRKTVTCGLEKPPTAISKIENLDENVRNPSEKESIYPIERKASTNTSSTSETQSVDSSWHVLSEIEIEWSAAKALETEYINKYGKEYSKELLFAVDLMTLVRYLNHLEMRYIIYGTNGNPPTSPCNDTMDQALAKRWKLLMSRHGDIFETHLGNKRCNYFRFQKMVLTLSEREERDEFHETSFITFCLSAAQLAVCSERNGILDAPEFIPLLICNKIQSLKDRGKLPTDFWQRLAEKAIEILIAD